MVRSLSGRAGKEKGFPGRGEMAMSRGRGEKFGRGELRKYRL